MLLYLKLHVWVTSKFTFCNKLSLLIVFKLDHEQLESFQCNKIKLIMFFKFKYETMCLFAGNCLCSPLSPTTATVFHMFGRHTAPSVKYVSDMKNAFMSWNKICDYITRMSRIKYLVIFGISENSPANVRHNSSSTLSLNVWSDCDKKKTKA